MVNATNYRLQDDSALAKWAGTCSPTAGLQFLCFTIWSIRMWRVMSVT